MLNQTVEAHRPWVPPAVDRFIRDHEDRFESMTPLELDTLLDRLLADHEQRVDHQCLALNAGSNVLNPKAARLLASGIGNRPSLGYPGAKYNTGMEQGEQIEILLAQLMRKLFGARYAEIRVPSGSMANLYAYMATTKAGDRIMSFGGEQAATPPITHAGLPDSMGSRFTRSRSTPGEWTSTKIDLPESQPSSNQSSSS